MKILHYCPSERNIRFFKNLTANLKELFTDYVSITDKEKVYIKFTRSSDFIYKLSKRRENSDIILISAHGWNDSILKAVEGNKYRREIPKEKTTLFQNDFVFALSCYTFNEFGQDSINNKALTYVGFDDSIEGVFVIEQYNYKSFVGNVEIIVRRVYMNAISASIDQFIKRCFTAKEFRQYLLLKLDKEISKLYRKSIEELNDEFGINLNNFRKEVPIENIKIEILSKIDYFGEKLKIAGEEYYIPWYFISYQSKEELEKLLEKTNKIKEENTHYKYFLQALILKQLGFEDKFLEILRENEELCLKTGQVFFFKQLYTIDETAYGLSD